MACHKLRTTCGGYTLVWLLLLCSIHLARSGMAGAASCDQPRWLQHQDPGTDMSCLYDWARIAGLAADQLELGYGQAGRGAIAKSNISGKATVVSMPRQFALSVVAGQKCPMPELIPAKLWDKSDESIQIALKVLKELKRGSNCAWYAYLQALPTEFDTLIHWSSVELAHLQMNSTGSELAFIEQIRERHRTLQQAYTRLQSTPMVTKLGLTYEELLWAVDIVTSRSFAIPKHWLDHVRESLIAILVACAAVLSTLLFKHTALQEWPISKEIVTSCRVVVGLSMLALLLRSQQGDGITEVALLPITDMLNHNSSLTSKIQPVSFGKVLNTVIGPHGFQAGEEVMHSYGVKPNEDFLRYYGFVDTDNIHDSYTVDLLEWIKQRYHLPEEGLLAVEADTAALHALQHASLGREGWSPGTIQALKQLLGFQQKASPASAIPNLGWMIPNSVADAIPWLQFGAADQSDPAEGQVHKMLYQVCVQISASKPTTLSDDLLTLQELQGQRSNHRHILALQFVIAKKQLLHSCAWQYDAPT